MNVVLEYLMYYVLIKVFIFGIDNYMIVWRYFNIIIICKLINEYVIVYLCVYID